MKTGHLKILSLLRLPVRQERIETERIDMISFEFHIYYLIPVWVSWFGTTQETLNSWIFPLSDFVKS
jgi:hypothetical protein